MPTTDPARKLFAIRLIHSLAWTIFAGAIMAIPFATHVGRLRLATWLSVLVWGEILMLALNGFKCPLTGVAARYTMNRAANFDIFLPVWLARWNKAIFGSLFAVAQLYLFATVLA